MTSLRRVHGGPDAAGPARWDFSTNANACGPCPTALAAVRQADPTRYPDPTYTELRQCLAVVHGVGHERVVPVASASEAIVRLTAWVARQGGQRVALPRHAYGDYAHAAGAWGLQTVDEDAPADLRWVCDPSSPLGHTVPLDGIEPTDHPHVLDCAYAPLRLTPDGLPPRSALDRFWQLWTPNKALGLTGIRGAYLIAPRHAQNAVPALETLGPSWPLGAHAVAMLSAWTTDAVQGWLADSRSTLIRWKTQFLNALHAQGWDTLPSDANFFCARPPHPLDAERLRAHGVQLRDCTSFGLPGYWRLGVLPPEAQHALMVAAAEQWAGHPILQPASHQV